MTRSLSALIGAAACTLGLGCEAPVAPQDIAALGSRLSSWQPDSSATLARLYYSGDVAAKRLVVGDQFTWASVWAQAYENYTPQAPRPSIDFGRYQVLVAALGQRGSGGNDIRIDSIARFERGSVAYVTTTTPGSTCVTTQAFTQPVHIVRVPANLAQDVVWENEAVVHECS